MQTALAWLRNRLPSRRELTQVFLTCVFPIHAWSLLAFLREIPGYILRWTIWDITSIFAYTQLFALFESLLVTSLLALLAFLLPQKFILEYFVSQSTILMILTALWITAYHYQGHIVQGLSIQFTNYLLLVGLWAFSFIGVLLTSSLLLRRSPKFKARILNFVDKLAVVSAVYLLFDLVGLLIIVYRIVFLLE